MSGAEILLDRPPGGWGDLVTNHTLDLRFAAWEERFAGYEQRFDRKVDALETRMDLRFAAVDHQFELMRAELRADLADLRADMDRRFRQQTLVMMSTFVALAGVMVAALRF